jgi:hypothetical protein
MNFSLARLNGDVPAIRVRRTLTLNVSGAFSKIVALGADHADRPA